MKADGRGPTVLVRSGLDSFPGWLDHDDDLRALMKALRLIDQVYSTLKIQSLLKRRLAPAEELNLDDDTQREDYARAVGGTMNHPVGMCAMGTPDQSVLDPKLRVRGVEGLRVADASVMPTIVSGNTNAPAIMLGEKAAALVTSVG